MVDYLVKSLGFSTKEAMATSTKVTHLKSTEKPDLVIAMLKECGLDQTQIKEMVFSLPTLLLCKVDKTLKPKFKVLQELGISGPDLVKIISVNPSLVTRGLNTRLVPVVEFLRNLLGCNEKVIVTIKNSRWLLCYAAKRFPPNILLLEKKYGFSKEKLEKFIIRYPNYLTQSPEWLEDKLRRVEEELRISRDSAMFFHGIVVLGSLTKSTIEMKFEIFRSFGWSDLDIRTMARNYPFCLKLSESNIRSSLNFFMKKLGYEPAYLASRARFFSCSLQKRVLPRYEIFKMLEEIKKLLENKKIAELFTVVSFTEAHFLEKYVLRYKDKIPGLFEMYAKHMEYKESSVELPHKKGASKNLLQSFD
jgi:mTERF domain-containing protein